VRSDMAGVHRVPWVSRSAGRSDAAAATAAFGVRAMTPTTQAPAASASGIRLQALHCSYR
jgi:hypothetical protein